MSLTRLLQAGRKALLLLTARRAYHFRFRPELFRLFAADAAHVLANLGLYQQLEPAPVPGLGPGPVLAVAAHPDDEAVGAGGSLLLAQEQGLPITLAFLTDGRPPGTPAGRSNPRREEAQAAARLLGARLEILGAPVRTFSHDRALVRRAVAWLTELVKEVKPGGLLTPFPLEAHSDHRLAAWITAQALAGLTPAPLVWAYEVASLCPANVVVEMGRLEEAKAAYINLYRSQVAQFDYARVALGLNRYHGRHLGGRGAAEAFFRVPAGEFRTLLDRLSPAQLFQEG